jgi:CelD/BcsL family acetyltransferase involved in cellulose biosynthesis
MVGQGQWSVLGTSSRTIDDPDSRRNSTASRIRQSYYGSISEEDNPAAAEGEKRRRELKNKILEGVKDFNVEQYRKSEAELKSIKNKRVREFYESQNQKLNDWAEVDSLVWSLADDVVDSIDPDANRDGVVDRTTPLLYTNYDLEAFLPQEEREKRLKNYRTAQRALNVSYLTFSFILPTAH